MLDYLTAGIAFWMTLFGVQEWLLEFRLGYLGRYWFLAIGASIFLGFLLSALVIVPLIINLTIDPFTLKGNAILSAIAVVIFGIIFSLGQWLLLGQAETTPRVFALMNTVIGILVYFLLVWLNKGSLEWNGSPFGNWKTALIFLGGGAITGGMTGKALDLYCGRVERRLLQLEREKALAEVEWNDEEEE
jgi:hypothetical protein